MSRATCYTSCMQRGTIARIASMLFIGAASAALLLRADPEYVTAVSENGVLTVTGFAREGGVTVTQSVGDAGDEYVVVSGAVDRTLPLQLRFALLSGSSSARQEDVDVLWYDETDNMWKWQGADIVDGFLVLRTMRLGRFALAAKQFVDAPDFVAVYDALVKQRPEGTIGYRIAVGYQIADGPMIRLDDEGEYGGCGGAVQPGAATAYAAESRTVHVLVNDVQTPVTFTFLAMWEVSRDVSCPEGQPFRAADGYATLPTSL